MKILMVGAGAVGQVYAHFLKRSGASVSFLVKSSHLPKLSTTLPLYHLNRPAPKQEIALSGCDYITIDELNSDHDWDQIWLAVSSPALQGEWRQKLFHMFPKATVISLQPGIHDRALILQDVSEEKLVSGMITLVSYQCPLPHEDQAMKPGYAFWIPPLSKVPFSGPAHETLEVVRTISKGGFPAKVVSNVSDVSHFGSAVLMSHIAALELCGWSFKELARSPQMHRASQSARQIIRILERDTKRRAPLWSFLIRPWTMKAVLRIAPLFTPFDFEAFLHAHFKKVKTQTVAMLGSYSELGKAHALQTAAIDDLHEGLMKEFA